MVLTASATGVTAFREEAEAAASTCLVQPAWSHTPIPVAWSAMRSLWRAPATVVPLSLFAPQKVAQAKPWAAVGGGKWTETWPAANFAAAATAISGVLASMRPTNWSSALPDSARAFRCGLGIDAAVGDRGASWEKSTSTRHSPARPLVPKPAAPRLADRHFHGRHRTWPAESTTRQLVLVVEDGGDARGPNADPLDIGDHADWLEPTLLLDPVKLRAAVAKYRLAK